MANNQYVNKVKYGANTLIDLTSDTVSPGSLLSGYTAHDASGAPIVGTADSGTEAGGVTQDPAGYIVLDDDSGLDYQTVTKSYTPTESQQTETITAGAGYDAIEQVNVTVGAISSSYVGSSITRRSSSDLSASGATVTAPAGYYASNASKSVASGTEGTPTASKGSVSNHSVTVTPSVTNSAGYISGGTKTGTGVTVSASELVSGTKSISANGTDIDVTDYAAVDVAVSSSATLITKSITANGTYSASSDNADGYSSVTVSVSGGGGGDMSDPIRFFDYDGTLVASYSSVPASLPSVPIHTGLTNGTWNYTLAQVQTQFNAMGICDVGANYDTASGATEIDIELQEGRLHPYLSLAVNGTVSVDWGDGSTPSTSTGTSLTVRKSDIHHEYSAAGKYTIKITKTGGAGYSLYCTSTYSLLNKNSSTAGANRVYSNCVQSVRVGEDCVIGSSAFYHCFSLASVSIPSDVTSIGGTAVFYNCYSLTSVSIPSDVTSIGAQTFYNCYSLTSVSIPSGVTSIGANAFYYCYSLASISIPSGVTDINTSVFGYCYSLAYAPIPSGVTKISGSMFYYCYSLASISIPSDVTSIDGSAFGFCYSLASISIPSDVTSIGAGAFSYCYSLASVTIPSSVTSIGGNVFNTCYGVSEYHMKPTNPPTLANTNAFNTIQSDCKIYVPAASLTDYQTAENWSTYASYMVGE